MNKDQVTALINSKIKANGEGDITASVLKEILLAINTKEEETPTPTPTPATDDHIVDLSGKGSLTVAEVASLANAIAVKYDSKLYTKCAFSSLSTEAKNAYGENAENDEFPIFCFVNKAYSVNEPGGQGYDAVVVSDYNIIWGLNNID